MEDRKYPSKLNNRGLTLIELIAVIAIIGVFGVVIASFITSTANFYRHASDTANVQRNMQNTLESIENLILDTNQSISYQADGRAVENDIGQNEAVEKLLVMESVTEDDKGNKVETVDVLRWRPDEQKLYYIRNPKNYGTIYGDVLAENVSGFNVDISKAKTEGVLRFQLSMTKRGEKITQTYTVALRNQLGTES